VWWIAYYPGAREHPRERQHDGPAEGGELLRERLRTAGTPQFIGPTAQRLASTTWPHLLTDYRVNGTRSLGHAPAARGRLRSTFGFDRALDITTTHHRLRRRTAGRGSSRVGEPRAGGAPAHVLAAVKTGEAAGPTHIACSPRTTPARL